MVAITIAVWSKSNMQQVADGRHVAWNIGMVTVLFRTG
jgi:hypothetical protein